MAISDNSSKSWQFVHSNWLYEDDKKKALVAVIECNLGKLYFYMQSRTVKWKFVLNKAKKINTLVAGNTGNEKNLYQAAAKKQKNIYQFN